MKHFFVLGWLLVFHVFCWSAWQVTKLRTEYSVDQFYPKAHPLLVHNDEISKVFRLHEEQPYLYVIRYEREGTWVEPGKVERLKKLSASLEEKSGVARVITLTHVEGATQGREELVIGSLFDRVPPQNWKNAVVENSLLYPLLVTEDFRSTLIMVESSSKNRTEMEKLEKELDQEIRKVFPDAAISSAGVPLLQAKLSGIIQKELFSFLLYTAAAFCIVFLFLFTHISAMLAAIGTLVITNLFALAMMGALGIPMNAILVTLPVIVSVSIMSLLIHTLHLWSGKAPHTLSGEERLREAFHTMKELALPNFLGILTTAMGFLALSPSPIPLISQYGWAVAVILTCVSFVAQVVMLLILPLVKSRLRSFFDRPAQWALLATRHPKTILVTTCFIFIFGIKEVSGLNFSLRLFDDLPENDSVRLTTESIDKSFGGILSYELSAVATEDNFWKSPANLLRLEGLGKKIRSIAGARTAVSISDFFQGEIPADPNAVAETYFLFSMAEKNPLASFLTEDARSTRIGIRLSDLPSHEITATKDAIRNIASETFPELAFTEGGMANYAHDLNQEVARSLIFDFWQPLLFIGLFLILIFRSLRWAIIACLPNFIPPAVLITALSVLDVSVKPGIALIFSIALGFAFNNTLYVLSRLRTLKGAEGALDKALLMEANPCLLESLIMFTGFAIFLTSEFDMNQNFGGFMLLSIFAGFFADLFFLPAFLKMFPKALKSRTLSGSVATSVTLLMLVTPAHAENADEILKKSKALIDAKDDQAELEMKIIEKNGESKMRNLTLKTLREEGFSVLAKIDSPADIKNMAFLGQVDPEGNEKQWIYLPSSGQVRRLVTGKSKAGLLGSEISPEDLNSEAVKGATTKLTKTDKDYFWIEVIPKAGSSDYSKVVTKISKGDYLPKFTAYYLGDKLKKTIAFKDYKKFGPVFRAQLMTVQNHQNGRGTEVRISSVKVNMGLSGDDFTQGSLKD